MKGLSPRLLLFFAVLPSAVLTVCWAVDFLPAISSIGLPGMAGAVSSILAQNGLVLLVILVFLGSRNSLVERSVGLDRMLRSHKPWAVIAVGLLLGHVLLQFLRFYITGGPDLVNAALLTTDIWEMVVGRLALILIMAASIPALLGSKLRLSFRIWKPVHLLVYAAVPLGLVHAGFRGSTMGEFPRVQVLAILTAATALAVIMRLVEALHGKRRALYRVSRVVPESHETSSIYLRPARGLWDLSRRRPGQFALLRIPRGRGLSEPHPFTISNEPAEELRFTIKKAGRFTREVHGLEPGTEVRCEGPYGVFCARADERASLALIAGGVGITPFLSLLRYFLETGRAVPTVLVWANKARRDIFGREELESMTRKIPLRVVHVLSREKEMPRRLLENGDGVSFEKGRITAEILGRHLRGDQGFYLCGPPAMQTFVLREIKKAFGLRAGQVSRELFFW